MDRNPFPAAPSSRAFSDATRPSPAPQSVSPAKGLAGKRIVVVEDEGLTQMHLRRLLVAAGLVVVGVEASGPKAVVRVLQEKPDIVLMDIRMPGEYDGLEAARRILAQFSTCIVMLTAFDD